MKKAVGMIGLILLGLSTLAQAQSTSSTNNNPDWVNAMCSNSNSVKNVPIQSDPKQYTCEDGQHTVGCEASTEGSEENFSCTITPHLRNPPTLSYGCNYRGNCIAEDE